MKKLIIFATSLVLAAAGFSGCRKGPEHIDNGGKVKLTIKSSPAETVDTRTTLEGDRETGFNTVWNQATDKLGVYAHNVGAPVEALTANAQFGIISIVDGVATFGGSINADAQNRTYDLYAYYPRKADAGTSHTSVAASIAAVQTMPANGTFDHASDYMVAIPRQVDVTGGEMLAASIDNFQFRYLVGFMHLSVPGITVDGIAPTDVVKSVTITAQAGQGNPVLAGDFNLDLTDGRMAFSSTSSEVTVECPAGVTLANLDAWAVVNPFSLAAADQLSFTITTETHTIQKEVPLDGGFEMVEGSIKTFHMTIDENCVITELTDDPGHRLIRAIGGYRTSALSPGVGIFEVFFASYEGTDELWPDDPSDNGYFILLTFNTAIPAKARNWNIPEGTYPLAPNGGLGTLRGNWYCTMDAVVDGGFGDGGAMDEGTTVTVSGNGTDGYLITMDIVLENGTTLKAYYEGLIPIPNNAIRSTFTGHVDVTVGTGTAEFYGAQYGGFAWKMFLYSDGVSYNGGALEGTGFCLMSQLTSLDILGGQIVPSAIYTITNSTATNTALAGYAGGQTGFAGMWLFELSDGIIVNSGPIVSGYLTNTYVSLTEEYYIDMFGMDDADNNIAVRFIGDMTIIDKSTN